MVSILLMPINSFEFYLITLDCLAFSKNPIHLLTLRIIFRSLTDFPIASNGKLALNLLVAYPSIIFTIRRKGTQIWAYDSNSIINYCTVLETKIRTNFSPKITIQSMFKIELYGSYFHFIRAYYSKNFIFVFKLLSYWENK